MVEVGIELGSLEKSFFILSFVFLSELVIRQVQTNIY